MKELERKLGNAKDEAEKQTILSEIAQARRFRALIIRLFERVHGAQGETRTRKPLLAKDFKSFVYANSTTWAYSILRPWPESNRRIRVLQTHALPLGYMAILSVIPETQA
jgi:hypothetical protein